ncbi:MAG: PepSY-associated TM helix domain-containing protein [Gemmatimonadaceae bacterium]
MKLFRTILFWCHLTVGACVAAVVVIMSATGVLLTYQKQMTSWADRRAVVAGSSVAGAERLPAEELLRRARVSAGAPPTAITLRSRADAPAEVGFGRDRRELVNGYTGETLGQGSVGIRRFFRVVTAWHRSLGATGDNRAIARNITGAANLGFLFLVISGFYLWWPRNWTAVSLRNVTLFRRQLSGKARDFNWHNVIGFWSALPLAVIVASGVVISYRWAGDLVYRSVREAPPGAAAAAAAAPAAAPERVLSAPSIDGLNALFARAEQRMPGWTTITAQLPADDAKTMSFSLDGGTGGQPQLRSTLVLDRASANEVQWEQFSTQSLGRRLRTILRYAHTGEVLGIAGQTIAGLVSLGVLVLAWTGVTLSLRRLGAWRDRRASRAPTTTTPSGIDVAA